MRDQATELRALVRQAASGQPIAQPPYRMVVSGGKGGVGTTTVAVNLALALTELGRPTLLVDADLQRADASQLCQQPPAEGIAEVLSGLRNVHEVLVTGPSGLQILPGNWAPGGLSDITARSQSRLISELNKLGQHSQVAVMDVGSGLNHVVGRFWHHADEVLLVTRPEPTAIMDAYTAIKVFLGGPGGPPVHVLINQCESQQAANEVFGRLTRACHRFLGRTLSLAGWLSHDLELAGGTTGPAALFSDPQACETIRRLAAQCDPHLKRTTRADVSAEPAPAFAA